MSRVTELVESVFETLSSSNDPMYGSRPIPCEFDAKISGPVNVFIQGNSTERNAILDSIRPEYSDALFAFAERMAALGVREDARPRLVEGLLALLIEGAKFDLRENLRILAPLYHAGTKI